MLHFPPLVAAIRISCVDLDEIVPLRRGFKLSFVVVAMLPSHFHLGMSLEPFIETNRRAGLAWILVVKGLYQCRGSTKAEGRVEGIVGQRPVPLCLVL